MAIVQEMKKLEDKPHLADPCGCEPMERDTLCQTLEVLLDHHLPAVQASVNVLTYKMGEIRKLWAPIRQCTRQPGMVLGTQ